MRLDPIVARRFEELTAKADAVSKSRKPDGFNGSTYSVSSSLFREWATNSLSLVERTFGKDSVHFTSLSEYCSRFAGWESVFEDCRGIFKAAREDYEGGYLFNVRAMVKAEALSDALSQARELLVSGYKDPSCVLCRVALEVTLKELCERKTIPHGKLEKMNADLCKAGVYNMVKQKQVTAWADIGNKAAHGEGNKYTENDAKAMLDGVEALIADIL